ncbi:hypothetical protein EVAR_55674_1 [Eumeta japonica]|uniref:Uncharacterized protein n=1 Tax=Eumeta variegata TaxID=151549 RepID=A0A4C1ZYB7_EUMVA|nr:hypothetical protein EVAR_55674_1 [Eumeta japonica]
MVDQDLHSCAWKGKATYNRLTPKRPAVERKEGEAINSTIAQISESENTCTEAVRAGRAHAARRPPAVGPATPRRADSAVVLCEIRYTRDRAFTTRNKYNQKYTLFA